MLPLTSRMLGSIVLHLAAPTVGWNLQGESHWHAALCKNISLQWNKFDQNLKRAQNGMKHPEMLQVKNKKPLDFTGKWKLVKIAQGVGRCPRINGWTTGQTHHRGTKKILKPQPRCWYPSGSPLQMTFGLRFPHTFPQICPKHFLLFFLFGVLLVPETWKMPKHTNVWSSQAAMSRKMGKNNHKRDNANPR